MSRRTYCSDRLSHVDEEGRARMVDVSAKAVTARRATAACYLLMAPATLELLRSNALRKGDARCVAELAGVQAAKRAAGLIPLCHFVPLDHVAVRVSLPAAGASEPAAGASEPAADGRVSLPAAGASEPAADGRVSLPAAGASEPAADGRVSLPAAGASEPPVEDGRVRVRVSCEVACAARTGAEMEALAGAALAALALFDMCKAVDRRMRVTDLRVEHKSGGRSGQRYT